MNILYFNNDHHDEDEEGNGVRGGHHHGQEDGVRGGQQNRKFMDGLKVARNQKKSASHVADRVCTTQINDDIDDDARLVVVIMIIVIIMIMMIMMIMTIIGDDNEHCANVRFIIMKKAPKTKIHLAHSSVTVVIDLF